MNKQEIIKQHMKELGSKGGNTWWYRLSKDEQNARIEKMKLARITKGNGQEEDIDKPAR